KGSFRRNRAASEIRISVICRIALTARVHGVLGRNVSGPDLGTDRAFAARVRTEVAKIPVLRDLQHDEPLDYPSIDLNVDRERAGQLGVTTESVGKSFLAATSSSRFVAPNYWADPRSGVAYQVQVQVPQSEVTSIQNVEHIGEYHRLNGQVVGIEAVA